MNKNKNKKKDILLQDETFIQFWEACEKGDLVSYRRLIRKIYDVNKFYKERTPLYIACEKRKLNIVKELVKHEKININEGNKNWFRDDTPLFAACFDGIFEIVMQLLSHKMIDVNKGNIINKDEFVTPLFIASYKGNVEIIKELLKNKEIEVNKGINVHKEVVTPLIIATRKNHFLCVFMLLLDDRINIYQKDDQNKTAKDYSINETILLFFVYEDIGKTEFRRIFSKFRDKENELYTAFWESYETKSLKSIEGLINRSLVSELIRLSPHPGDSKIEKNMTKAIINK